MQGPFGVNSIYVHMYTNMKAKDVWAGSLDGSRAVPRMQVLMFGGWSRGSADGGRRVEWTSLLFRVLSTWVLGKYGEGWAASAWSVQGIINFWPVNVGGEFGMRGLYDMMLPWVGVVFFFWWFRVCPTGGRIYDGFLKLSFMMCDQEASDTWMVGLQPLYGLDILLYLGMCSCQSADTSPSHEYHRRGLGEIATTYVEKGPRAPPFNVCYGLYLDKYHRATLVQPSRRALSLSKRQIGGLDGG